ncbi:hypothetical protein JW906_02470, partial [bacterium]|nr:hypothetical protein [bacterium]
PRGKRANTNKFFPTDRRFPAACGGELQSLESDPGAVYSAKREYQAGSLEPLVAQPFSPARVKPARELKDVRLDQCYIGSCTGGKVTDFRAAASILRNKEVRIKTVIVPATRRVAEALDTEQIQGQTLTEIFKKAGAAIGPPSCAACLGGPEDTFGRLNHDEVCISTTNRNFPGRMGSRGSKTFLASPLTAAASALTGRITDPREMMED